MRRLTEFGPSAAFYIFAMAAQVSGFVSPSIALLLAVIATLLLFIPACHHSHAWHKARKNDGRNGLDSWYFIVPCLAVALIGIAGASYGLGLRSSAAPQKETADQLPERERLQAQAQIDRLTRIAFVSDTLKRFEEVQARLPDAAKTRFEQLGKPHWPGQSILLMTWSQRIEELQKIYKEFSGKDVDLKAAPRFAENQMRAVPGEAAMPNDEKKVEFRKFYDQVATSEATIPKLRREMIDELNGLKSQAYTTRLGVEK